MTQVNSGEGIKLPLYKQIYAVLSKEIRQGTYTESGALPSEHELCTRFGVERVTVRKSLKMLVDDGIIRRIPGVGSKLIDNNETLGVHDNQQYSMTHDYLSREVAHIPNNTILIVTQEDYLQSSNSEGYHYRLIYGFEKRFSNMGYNLMIRSIGEASNMREIINQTMPTAIIFDSYVGEARYLEALNAGIPCVSVNHYTPLMTSIVSNNFDGAYQVVKMLKEEGHKKIVFITGKEKYQTNIERMSGVQRFYDFIGEVLDKNYIFKGNYSFDSGFEAGKKILMMSPEERPTVVFAFNDDMAFGCYSCFTSNNIKVPEDVGIVGFDRSERFNIAFGTITTVDVNIEAMIDYTCWYMSGVLTGTAPDVQSKIQIDTQIINSGGTVRPLI